MDGQGGSQGGPGGPGQGGQGGPNGPSDSSSMDNAGRLLQDMDDVSKSDLYWYFGINTVLTIVSLAFLIQRLPHAWKT